MRFHNLGFSNLPFYHSALLSLCLSPNGLPAAPHTYQAYSASEDYSASGLSSLIHVGLCSDIREAVQATLAKNSCPSLTLSLAIVSCFIFLHSIIWCYRVYSFIIWSSPPMGGVPIYLLSVPSLAKDFVYPVYCLFPVTRTVSSMQLLINSYWIN